MRIYPIPYGTGLEIAAWVSVAVSIASTAYALFFAPKPELGGFSSSNASSLDLNPAKANTAKLGDPVKEAFGRNRIYPDYLVQPVTRFDPADPTRMTVEMFVCLGYGRFSYTGGDFLVGETPALTLGEGFHIPAMGTAIMWPGIVAVRYGSTQRKLGNVERQRPRYGSDCP